ncbi:cell division protein FtsQ/DivIB [Terriglobus saanensis]|uniref:Cell division protein FtsQ n=1 Tax=Terriglobus saanensis (strain ATCC BAA-1853 / DSM 23119 / SP1PR4) TaxID=401053 RepID=E8V7Q5_TERSS|nr:FtsQ-type POTRA domain-containing protein [Terriglobus saanensis]ADV81753.1 Polypeptide-transport-associated domain protein FtsQ-type [Terriglobus saanensis SP1PR4]
MRTKDVIGKRASAVLDTPEDKFVPENETRWSRGDVRRPEPPRPRREMVEDFSDDADTAAFLRSTGRGRRIRRGLIPQTKWGRIAAGSALALFLGGMGAAVWTTSRFLMHDEHFLIPSSQAIEIDGNSHVSRAQMLSVFGEDVDRNIFHVPLAERRTELETMPWVEHASVMRLLPNRIRVHVVERTPVAFVRQGGTIGMVDVHGVLLNLPADSPGNPNYSFPVVTGISSQEPLSTRAPRMKLYTRFIQELDGGDAKLSGQLSEVDLSDPEDVKALIPDHNTEVLVHFGEENFLDRFHRMQEHMPEWRQQYPRLASVDMRYERQVVLQMPQNASGGGTSSANAPAPVSSTAPTAVKAAPLAVVQSNKVQANKPAPSAPVIDAEKKTPAVAKTVAPKKPAAPAKVSDAKAAASAKRVAAIKLWMAQREKVRQAQKSAVPHTSTGAPVRIAPMTPGQTGRVE